MSLPKESFLQWARECFAYEASTNFARAEMFNGFLCRIALEALRGQPSEHIDVLATLLPTGVGWSDSGRELREKLPPDQKRIVEQYVTTHHEIYLAYQVEATTASLRPRYHSLMAARLGSLQAALQAIPKPGNATPEAAMKSLQSLFAQKTDSQQFDLEKDWHTVYYLLTGECEIAEEHREGNPLHNLIFGGLKTTVNTSYGPVRYFNHGLTSEIVAALGSLDMTVLNERFNAEEMEERDIYAAPDVDEKEGIFQVIEELRCFVKRASEAKEYVLRFAT